MGSWNTYTVQNHVVRTMCICCLKWFMMCFHGANLVRSFLLSAYFMHTIEEEKHRIRTYVTKFYFRSQLIDSRHITLHCLLRRISSNLICIFVVWIDLRPMNELQLQLLIYRTRFYWKEDFSLQRYFIHGKILLCFLLKTTFTHAFMECSRRNRIFRCFKIVFLFASHTLLNGIWFRKWSFLCIQASSSISANR